MDRTTPRPTPSGELRCSYCHGSAAGADACSGCGTLLHPTCRAEAGRCVTLGCVVTARPREVREESPARIASTRSSLGTALVLAVLVLWPSLLVLCATTAFDRVPAKSPVNETRDVVVDDDDMTRVPG